MNGGKCETTGLTDDLVNEMQLNIEAVPNPFSEQTKITLTIPETINASIRVFNSLGQKVYSVPENHFEKGIYNFNIDLGKSENQGVYYCVYSDGMQLRSTILNLLK